MRLKNIFAILGIASMFISCSNETSVIDDFSQTEETGNAAYVSINVSSISTKATETQAPTVAEKQIDHCSVIILDGNADNSNVVYAQDNVAIIGNDSLQFNYLTKINKTLYVAVIANSNKLFATGDYKTWSAVKAVEQNDNVNAMVKVSDPVKVDWSGVVGTTGTAIAANRSNVASVSVPLTQLDARIELTSITFNGNFDGTIPENVYVDSLIVNNCVKNSYTDTKKQLKNVVYVNKTLYLRSVKIWDVSANEQFTTHDFSTNAIYTFQNNPTEIGVSGNKTTIQLAMRVGNRSFKTKQFALSNTAGAADESGIARAGYCYKLNVTMTKITGSQIECTIKVTVKDWIVNTVTVNLEEE